MSKAEGTKRIEVRSEEKAHTTYFFPIFAVVWNLVYPNQAFFFRRRNSYIIPFRESKLTHLFQGFFCGKDRASMIVNVDVRASMFDKTLQAGFSYGKRGEKIAVLQSTNKYLEWKPEYISHPSFTFCYVQATTRVSKLVNLRPPSKKARRSAPTRCSKPARLCAMGQWNASRTTPSRWSSNTGGGRRGRRKRSPDGGAWCLSTGVWKNVSTLVCGEGWGLSSD